MPIRVFGATNQHEDQLIREELAWLLQSSSFASSKRYPAFLTYVVEATLAGRASELKERTVGVEVFHRRPDFDTNSDTVVRFTAGEVRKRLATVYHQNGPDRQIQIELPIGSYVPEFFRICADAVPPEAPAAELERPEVESPKGTVPLKRPALAVPLYSLVLTGIVTILLLSSIIGVRIWIGDHDPLHRFWQPVLAAGGPVVFCPGAMVFAPNGENNVTKALRSDPYPYISVATARALSELVGMFAGNKTEYSIHPTAEISLSDMRAHPVVLIGAYSNEWTYRLVNGLRYRLTEQPRMEIYDSTNESIRWARPPQIAYQEADDYAIVARFRDQMTGNMVVIAGGIGKNGTEAAAQFITSSRFLALLDNAAGEDWSDKNIECVIKINVVDGKAGSPSVMSVYTW